MKRASAASDDLEAELDHRIGARPRCGISVTVALSSALVAANEYSSASLHPSTLNR